MHLSPAKYVIKIFGGTRPTARALGRVVGTVGYWKKRGNIPGPCQKKILEIARQRNLDITPNDLMFGRTF